MRSLIVMALAGAVGAAALGVFKGMEVKDQILDERRQAREDSIAAVALANSEAAQDTTGVDASDPAPDSSAAVDGGAEGDSASAFEDGGGQDPETGGGDEGGGGAPSEDTGPSPEELAEAERQAREAEALAQQTLSRLSKIFSEMKPGEAADVLSYLSDAEIERVLLGIRERDAAAILAQLEPERAAAVSRRVLRSG
ncbi:MAG: hypothetical protein HKO53_00085, partial [Gemmatimonadetes bacterium]|nr:hypothetical protein [Gemmatimonadota bacterium]